MVCSLSILLTSCGKTGGTANVGEITPDTAIKNSAQAEKVCQPLIEYLQCSLKKAPEAHQDMHQKILDETLKKIKLDDPSRVAQECDTYMKILKESPDIAFKNGCEIKSTVSE